MADAVSLVKRMDGIDVVQHQTGTEVQQMMVFLIGMCVGAMVGVFAIALCVVGRNN